MSRMTDYLRRLREESTAERPHEVERPPYSFWRANTIAQAQHFETGNGPKLAFLRENSFRGRCKIFTFSIKWGKDFDG